MNMTVEEYARRCIPFGAWVVVQKLKAAEKIGSIIVPIRTSEHNTKLAMMGKVIAKSPFDHFETEHEYYIMNKIKVGDVVGFSATVPVYSPAPPDTTFEGGLNSEGLDIATLHVADILNIFCEDDTKIDEIRARF